MLTPDECKQVADLRDSRLRLEVFEFACDESVANLRTKTRVLRFISFCLAVGVLFVLYIVSDVTIQVVISRVATGLSLIVMFMLLWGYMAKWDQQIETKATLSNALHDGVEQFQLAEESLDAVAIRQCKEKRISIEKQRKHETALVSRRHLSLGHQHVAKRYPDYEIECTVCRRKWDKAFANQSRLWLYLPWTVCTYCGIRRK